ncbi:JmjC domain-containing protein [Nocardia goodfellowii]|uniref:Ribosomal protein L16 Arg81 hydroxylase n=1 Tax=Nocardia goodfellowii TaxID=882446 RepID=A0ABS4QHF4_9NOCA|nr:cupin domain-containing protein [Nocardia goodfellowii]MBP2191130.1 ribosomal protein L16 Arg81 hydroxylase [Nocardia goodfellowii]
MVQDRTHSFAGLIAPVTKSEFIDKYWGKSTLVLHRTEPDYFGSLFSLADLDACLMTAANRSSKILQVIPPPSSGRSSILTSVSALSKDRLYDAYLSGDTIRLLGVEKVWPPFELLAADVREALDVEIGFNLFLTPPNSQGFPTHVDTLDSFIVQIAGAKQWYIWDPIYDRPLGSQRSNELVAGMKWAEEELTLRDKPVLKAGDVAYLPRGFFHKAVAGDEFSLHVTISFHPLTWVDFFGRAVELAAMEDLELRQDLPPGFVQDREKQEHMSLVFAHLLDRLSKTLSFEATLGSLVDEQVSARTFPPDGHFSVLAGLDEIGPNSTVNRRSGLACLVENAGSTAVIRFGPKRVEGPKGILSTLEFIRDHRTFRVRDLPDSVSLNSKITLVRRLIRDGLLRPV